MELLQMYIRQVVMNSTNGHPVIQPTGMQMLRYWQAYMSVKDAQFPNPDVRTLAVVQDTVQLRLSSLVITVGAFLVAVIAACAAKYLGVKHKTHRIQLPSSQLDWMVQAAREHAQTKEAIRGRTKSPNEFAIYNQDNFFIVSPRHDPCIAIQSQLSNLEVDTTLSSLQTPTDEAEFDPWVGYNLHLASMSRF